MNCCHSLEINLHEVTEIIYVLLHTLWHYSLKKSRIILNHFLNLKYLFPLQGTLKSPCGTVPHSHLGRADLKWAGVIAIDVSSGAKEGVHPLSKRVSEGVDWHHADRVGKGHLSRVVVQLHPDSGKLSLKIQRGAGPRHGRVLALEMRDHPKAALGTARDASFSVDGLHDDSKHPVCLVAYLHLPGVTTWSEALWAQHEHKVAEAFGIGRELLEGSPVGDTGQVCGEGQPGVGSVGVQGDRCWKEHTRSQSRAQKGH